MHILQIPLAKPWIDEEEIKAVAEVLRSGWIIQGPKVKEFEERFAEYQRTKYAVACNSCTAALHISLAAIGIKPGDEVIVPAFSFIASANAVLYQGAKPVFVDIDPSTYNIDPEKIEENITKKTRAIIPVHLFGQPADMGPVLEIAESHDLYVIEDAACAHGAEYHKKRVGGLADAGCFSFHPRKPITTGEGGMITTNDEEIARKARAIRSHGMSLETWERTEDMKLNLPSFSILGYNYRMTDISAAIGLIQMKRIDDAIERRIKVAERFNEAITKIDGIKPPKVIEDVRHVYQSYVCKVDLNKHSRDDIILGLSKRGIAAQIGTQAIHLEPLYRQYGYKKGDFPSCEDAFFTTLSLPIFAEITDEQINQVINALADISKA
jgi:dTDP-4-amino-4,6-dideoxygalactose transaminase